MDVDLKGCPLIGFWNHSLEGDGGLPRWKSIQLWPEGDSTIHPGKSQFLRFLGIFLGKHRFFLLLVISPRYIWGEASTPVVRFGLEVSYGDNGGSMGIPSRHHRFQMVSILEWSSMTTGWLDDYLGVPWLETSWNFSTSQVRACSCTR